MSAVVTRTPNQACPVSTLPAARIKPCAGKYIDIYVGFMVTCMVSKCTHIAGVGFVRRPEAKVSAASRKLKSFVHERLWNGRERKNSQAQKEGCESDDCD